VLPLHWDGRGELVFEVIHVFPECDKLNVLFCKNTGSTVFSPTFTCIPVAKDKRLTVNQLKRHKTIEFDLF
jgi:hypothetical protein